MNTAPFKGPGNTGRIPMEDLGISMNTEKLARYSKSAKTVALAAVAIIFCVAAEQASGKPQQTASTPIKITTTKLENVTAGRAYSVLIEAMGGKPPFVFSATGLPDGLAIRNFSDRISGTTTAVGDYSVVIKITDSAQPTPQTAMATLPLKVVAAKQ